MGDERRSVLGAAAVWLPIYQAGRSRSMYLGDEATPPTDPVSTHGVPL
jgi:hypothetical protein